MQWLTLFTNIHTTSINFIIAVGQIIKSEEIGTISIPLNGDITIKLKNVELAPECDSNLISFGQRWENGITYHNSLTIMTLIRESKVIAQAKRDQNILTLDLASPGQAMSVKYKLTIIVVIRQGWATHLVNKNKCIYIWHWRLAHICNIWIIRASKLIDDIDQRICKYDLSEILIDSDDSDSNLENVGADIEQTPVIKDLSLSAIANQTNEIDGNWSNCVAFM